MVVEEGVGGSGGRAGGAVSLHANRKLLEEGVSEVGRVGAGGSGDQWRLGE